MLQMRIDYSFIIQYNKIHRYKLGMQKYKSQASRMFGYIFNDQYLFGQEIGNGSYGHLYYAEDKQKNQYAIKVCNLEINTKALGENEKIIGYIQKEGSVMMNCDSPFTIKCYQSFKDQEKKLQLIVMQLCSFTSLQDLIYTKGHLTPFEAKKVLKHILCGLSEIHKHGFCHRDVKSANVCLKQNRCILGDFGSSKQSLTLQEKISWRQSYSKPGTVTGTTISKSPEMLKNKKYGRKTDFWALGILLYQCLTGVQPFCFQREVTDEEALQDIQKNIDKIYDQDYIKSNLQKIDLLQRGNSKLRKEEIDFLKKLIVIQDKNRIFWKELENEQYLTCCTKQYYGNQCFLPLEDISWKQFYLKNLLKQISPSPSEQEYNRIRNNHQFNLLNLANLGKCEEKKQQNLEKCRVGVYSLEKLTTQIKDHLKKQGIKMHSLQKKVHRRLRINHFQIKRLELIMKARDFINFHQDCQLTYQRLQVLLSMYCILKIKSVTEDLNSIQGMGETNIKLFFNYIASRYTEDKQKIKPKTKSGILNKLHKALDLMKRNSKSDMIQQIIEKESMETVNNYIAQACAEVLKLTNKKDDKTKNSQFQLLLQKAQQIMNAKYEPQEKNPYWQPWSSFDQILKGT